MALGDQSSELSGQKCMQQRERAPETLEASPRIFSGVALAHSCEEPSRDGWKTSQNSKDAHAGLGVYLFPKARLESS